MATGTAQTEEEKPEATLTPNCSVLQGKGMQSSSPHLWGAFPPLPLTQFRNNSAIAACRRTNTAGATGSCNEPPGSPGLSRQLGHARCLKPAQAEFDLTSCHSCIKQLANLQQQRGEPGGVERFGVRRHPSTGCKTKPPHWEPEMLAPAF